MVLKLKEFFRQQKLQNNCAPKLKVSGQERSRGPTIAYCSTENIRIYGLIVGEKSTKQKQAG